MAECSKCGDMVHVADGMDWDDDSDVCYTCLLNECGELREQVNHWRTKATCYGNIVHGCTPALEAAGCPVDASQADGAVGGIRRAVERLAVKLKAARDEDTDPNDTAAIRCLEQEYAEYWTIQWEGGEWCVWDCYGQHGGESTCIAKSPSPTRALMDAGEWCVKRGQP